MSPRANEKEMHGRQRHTLRHSTPKIAMYLEKIQPVVEKRDEQLKPYLSGQKASELVGRGESHLGDVPSERLAPLVEQETDYARLAEADCISICVPTPLRITKEPDISQITAAVSGLAPHLGVGRLVVLESTSYPGTTEELIVSKIGAGRRETADFLPGKRSVVLALPRNSFIDAHGLEDKRCLNVGAGRGAAFFTSPETIS